MKIKSSKGEILTVPDGMEEAAFKAQAEGKLKEFADSLKERMKSGGMIKRKDGSYSRRGLWDNIRANRGSGKKPTKEMLEQEAKIRAKEGAGGVVFKGYVTEQPISDPVPFHTSTIGRKKRMKNGGPTFYSTPASERSYYDPIADNIYVSERDRNDPGLYPHEMYHREQNLHNDLSSSIYWPGPLKRPQTPSSPTDTQQEAYFNRKASESEFLEDAFLNKNSEFQFVPREIVYNKFVDPVMYNIPGTLEGDAQQFSEQFAGPKMGKGGYTVKRSSARKGKTHVVIGPDGTKKYFGDSKLGQHPKDPARKKSFYARHAKNLKNNPYFRAFARATWADGGKLGQGIYDMGLMPYGDGGYTMGNMNPDGLISLPYGYGTPAYNERERFGFGGDLLKGVGDVGLYLADNATSVINQDIIGDKRYSDTGFGKAVKDVSHISGAVTGALAPMAATAIGGPAAGMAVSAAQQASGQFVKPDQERMASKSGQIGSMVGQAAGIGSMFYNPFGAASAGSTLAGASTPLQNMMAMYGGAVRMDDGGQTGMVPINVEGANFSQGSGPDAKKGELLVKNGKIVKNYVGRPPHPAEGQNPMGNDEAPEGLIVIPKNRTAEYLEAGLIKRKQMEISLVSQQQDREMKKAKRPSKKMGDGGYYSFGMGDMGMARGGMAYSDQLGGHDYAAKGGPIGNPETIDSMLGYGYKKGGWIQKATASIKRRGTEGVCTGSKFGGPTCPPGSRRYNLAKTFRKMAKARKHEHGGMIDPVTGSHNLMYAEGGQLPESLLRTRMKASGASQEEINDYVAANYGYGGMTMYGEGGQLPENLLRARMRASGKSPAEINSYVAARYEMGGPVNVDRSAIYQGMRKRAMYATGAEITGGVTPVDKAINTFYDYDPFNATWADYSQPGYFSTPESRDINADMVMPGQTSQPSAGIEWGRNSIYGTRPSLATRNPNSMAALRGTPEGTMSERYMQGVDNSLKEQFPEIYSTKKYSTPDYSSTAKTPSNVNWGNVSQDLASAAPILYNLGRGIFEKPYQMRAEDYMTPDMQFRATRFDETPYQTARSRAMYGMRQVSGPGYRAGLASLGAGLGQAESEARLGWQNQEALRRQGVDQANAEIMARNKATQMQVNIMNQQARAARNEMFAKAAEQTSQEFGRNPRYFEAMKDDPRAYRQGFTGWRNTSRRGGLLYR